MPNTFLGSNAERNYDAYLKFPIVNRIRRQEQAKLYELFDRTLKITDNILEVGAGTGFYTQYIASKVNSVLALEPSKIMLGGLEKKQLKNVRHINSDFFDFQSAVTFDHVIAIGVLDYVADWQKFLEKCLALAQKSLIFTAPQTGAWSRIYQIGSYFEKIDIYLYTNEQLQEYFKSYRIEISDAGLKTKFSKGLNFIVTVEKI